MIIDINLLLRYILNDIPDQAMKAATIIAGGAEVYPEIIPEAVYVLSKIYGISRKDIADQLLLALEDISTERSEQLKEALRIYSKTKFDYIDCLLLAGLKIDGNDFMSFDKKLMNKKKSI